MKKTLLLFALSLLALPAFAQQTRIVPDCVIPFTFTAAAQHTDNTLTCGNNTLGIVVWTVVYSNFNFGALSLVVQSAPDAGGVPGAWSTFAGTVCSSTNCPGSSGVNPNTATTSAFTTLQGYYPWMRVLLTSVTGTGTITGKLYGCLSPGCSSTTAGTGGGGGGPTIVGTANEIAVTGTGCTAAGTCTISIPNNPVLPGLTTSAGFKSAEALSGYLELDGVTSGTVAQAVNDVAGTGIVYVWPATNGIAGQALVDNGTTTCPTLPGGAPAVCHGMIWATPSAGGAAGGGVLGFSASSVTLPGAGTTFLAPVGGAAASGTEGTVTASAPAAAAISNMYVTLSAAPGAGNTIAFTFRDAGSSTAVTCTISGAVATTCNDITHTFTPVVGDALSIQVVTTGTVAITPSIKVIAEYGVTGGGTPGGSPTQFQANVAGAFAGVTGTSILPQTGWSLVNCGGQCVYDDFSAAEQTFWVSNNSSLNWRIFSRTTPGAHYTIIAKVRCDFGSPIGSSAIGCGLYLSDGTKLEGYEITVLVSPSTSCALRVEQITNVTTDGATIFGATGNLVGCSATLKIVNDGTHRTFSHWSNGAFVQDFQETTGTFLTETSFGLGAVCLVGPGNTYAWSQATLKYLAATTP